MRRFPLGRVGSRTKLRVAAGSGAIAVFLLACGTAIPVVSADPGHSRDGNGSHRGGDSPRPDGRAGRDRDGNERGAIDGNGRRGGGSNRTDSRTDYGRGTGFGSGADYGSVNDFGGSNDHGASNGTDRNGATTGSQRTAATNGSNSIAGPSPSSRSASAGQVPATSGPPGVPAPPAGGGGGSGAAPAGAAPVPGRMGTPITSPRVTIGNGRSPGILSGQGDDEPSQPRPVEDQPAPAPPPPQLPPPARLDMAKPWQLTVASLWAAAAPNRPGGLLFGLTGLVLAPLAGVWLGYRQARATKAASQLIRH
jgi:hypothetical protein